MELTRSCQQKAHDRTTELLKTHYKCIVKMFCGTGKSRVIRSIILTQKKPLSIVVFPSLALIRQFTADYLKDKEVSKMCAILNVSSEQLDDFQSTTEPADIRKFIKPKPKGTKGMKIVCVTYQSLQVLLDNLGESRIGLACFDEAHRTTSPEYSKLVYSDEYRDKYEKQVFFTATPVNANGITMFDRDRDEMGTYGDCGPLASEYTYLQGLRDDHLSLFELRVDLYTQDTVGNMYECIARAILTTGNTRVLTFHADAAEDSKSETSVLRFVDKANFMDAFRSVCAKEFPDKVGKFTVSNVTFTAITADTKNKDAILGAFETCTDDEIYIVSSCRTIGEGVDTKKANMCVFVDPKSSPKDIIQNIGRICRKVEGSERQPATVLIPVCIGWEKYVAAGDDAETQDKLIREQLNDRENGDYNAIMNVCAALKQEDPELYELCLKYPSNFTESERKHALEEQKRKYDPEDYVYGEEIDELVEDGERVEIHTSNIEQPIIYRGFDEEDEDAEDERPIQRFYEVEEENEDGEMETRYHRIVPMEGREEEDDLTRRLNPPKATNRPRMNIHTNDEIKLLWKMGDVMLGEQFGSGVLECEVERMDNVENWKENHDKMCEFINENGRVPSQNAKAKDENEKKLARWIGTQKRTYDENGSEFSRCIMKTNHEIWTTWTKTLADPKYNRFIKRKFHIVKSSEDHVQHWKITLSKVCEFIDTNKKTPSHSSSDENEKKLARWIYTQKRTYDENGSEHSGCIMKNVPEIWKIWNDTLADTKYKEHLVVDRIESWKIKHTEMCNYITQTGKSPCCSSKDPNTKKIAQWVSDQKKFYNPEGSEQSVGIMKIPEIWQIWTDTLAHPKYIALNRKIAEKTSKCPVQHWKNMFENVCSYIEKNKKAPSHSSKCKNEKSMEGWIHRQKESFDSNGSEFSNNIMKNAPEVWKLWSDALSNPKYKDALTSKSRNELNDDWKKTLLEVCNFIETNKKTPSYS
ncbi:MAG: DEAD/DEAH box helicase, partial [bacterium]